jgi:uncharacterized protein (DUF488 family)
MKIFTMGFTKKSAEQFFARLKQSGLKRIVDTRLNNVSQLAGFTKKDDLKFFLKAVLDIDYVHAPLLAPNKEILDDYKKNGGDWSTYERKFIDLMGSRHIESKVDRYLLDGACLLCSEPTPHHCHRRLVAEYLKEKWGDVEIQHL